MRWPIRRVWQSRLAQRALFGCCILGLAAGRIAAAQDAAAIELAPAGEGSVAASPAGAAMTPELQSILDRLDALEKKSAAAEAKAPEKPAAPAEEWVDMSTEKWNVKLGGHVQMDWIH